MRERSTTRRRLALAALVAILLQPAPAPALELRGPLDASFDLLVLRPLGLAETAVGLVLFVPAALISAYEGQAGLVEAWELHVSVPAENAFLRPLGEW